MELGGGELKTVITHELNTVSVTALSMVLIGVTIYVQTIVKSGTVLAKFFSILFTTLSTSC